MVVNSTRDLIQNPIPEACELPDGRLIQHVAARDVNRDGGPASPGIESAPLLEVSLHVEPVTYVRDGIVNHKNDRHGLS
jgi:hypothetical protein